MSRSDTSPAVTTISALGSTEVSPLARAASDADRQDLLDHGEEEGAGASSSVLNVGVPAASAVVRVELSGSESQCRGMPWPEAMYFLSVRPSLLASKVSSLGEITSQSSLSSVTRMLPGRGRVALSSFCLASFSAGERNLPDHVHEGIAEAVEANTVLEPVGVACEPWKQRGEIGLSPLHAGQPVDGEVQHDGLGLAVAVGPVVGDVRRARGRRAWPWACRPSLAARRWPRCSMSLMLSVGKTRT